MAYAIIEKLKQLTSPIFSRNTGEAGDAIADTEQGLGLIFPADYKALLNLSDGGSIQGKGSTLNYVPADELEGHNDSEFFKTYIPGMLVIGDDGGGFVYYFDPSNKLGKGAFSVFYVAMGSYSLDKSVCVGNTIGDVIEKILAGEKFRDLYLKNL